MSAPGEIVIDMDTKSQLPICLFISRNLFKWKSRDWLTFYHKLVFYSWWILTISFYLESIIFQGFGTETQSRLLKAVIRLMIMGELHAQPWPSRSPFSFPSYNPDHTNFQHVFQRICFGMQTLTSFCFLGFTRIHESTNRFSFKSFEKTLNWLINWLHKLLIADASELCTVIKMFSCYWAIVRQVAGKQMSRILSQCFPT